MYDAMWLLVDLLLVVLGCRGVVWIMLRMYDVVWLLVDLLLVFLGCSGAVWFVVCCMLSRGVVWLSG